MARWTDSNGVFHDTDNLAYGDQGDTRYWEGKPGSVGSVTYDRPKDQPGAQPTAVVVDSNVNGEPPIAVPLSGGKVQPGAQPVMIKAGGFVPATPANGAPPQVITPGVPPFLPNQPEMVITAKGAMTVDFLREELKRAGYGGPWDTASMVAAFNRAVGGIPRPTTPSTPAPGPAGGSPDTGRPAQGQPVGDTQPATGSLPTSLAQVQAWAAANPLPAALIAIVGLSMLGGGGRRRW